MIKQEELKELRQLAFEESYLLKKIKDYEADQGESNNEYIQILKQKKQLIREKVLAMEQWIDEIEDSRTRNVMRMYYQDGFTQKTIGEILSCDRSVISRIIMEAVKQL